MTSHLSDPLVGQILGNYAILGRIGTGGMAVVYKAKHLQFGRIVALKTLRTQDPVVMERFAREIKTLALLKHPNIVEAIDCLQAPSGQTFLVMEYIEGLTLEEFIKAEGCIKSEEDIASVITQICDALDHAHKQRIIHRDLKPPNIVLMEQDGKTTIKVLDFGIAKLQDELQKLTTVGQAMGSPLYMSPEQCTGQELSPASDIYTLGIVSYQMICGRHPYESSSVVEIMTSHCDPNKFPESLTDLRPDIAGVIQLNQAIFRMVATDPQKRFQSTEEVKKAINTWIQSTKTSDSETNSDRREEPESPRSRRQTRKAKQDGNLSKSVHKLSAFKKSEAVTKTVKLNQREVKRAEKNAHEAAPKGPSAGRLIAMVIFLPIVVLAAITALALNFEGLQSLIDSVTNNATAHHDSNMKDSTNEERRANMDGDSTSSSDNTTTNATHSKSEPTDTATSSSQESGSEAGSESPVPASETSSGTSTGESGETRAKSDPDLPY